MMVFMLFKTPFTAILNIQNTFARLESEGTKDKMILVKITYVLMNLLAVALGTWKINQMGLLPYASLLINRYNALMASIGPRIRTGWHGKQRGIHWREPSRRFQLDSLQYSSYDRAQLEILAHSRPEASFSLCSVVLPNK